MKIRYKAFLAAELLLARKVVFFLNIVMFSCSFLMMDILYTSMKKQTQDIDRFLGFFKTNIDNTYHMSFSGIGNYNDPNSIINFLNSIESIDGVHLAGGFYPTQISFVELENNSNYIRLMEQRKIDRIEAIPPTKSQLFVISHKGAEIFRCGITPDELSTKHNGMIPVFAGYAFQGILSMGDILTYKDTKCYVAGFIHQNSIGIKNGIAELALSDYIDLNYCFVINSEYMSPLSSANLMNSFFVVPEGNSNAYKVLDQIRIEAQRLDFSVEFKNVKSSLDQILSERAATIKLYEPIIVFLCVIALITATASAQTSLLLRKKEVGIWYANGVLQKDVCQMVIMVQFCRIAIPFGIAYLIGHLEANSHGELYIITHRTYTLVLLSAFAVIAFFISVLVPLFYVSRKKPAEMISSEFE